MSENMRGAVLMMAAMAAFVLNDALMKLAAPEVPLFQAVFLRGLGTTLAFVALAWRFGALRLPAARADRRLVAWRSVAEVGAAFLFLTALFNMPLANVTAILQSMPLLMTVAGALFLGERVGWWRGSAVAVGLLGVLLIVRPGGEGFDRWSLVALASVLCVVLRDVVTRKLSAEVPSLAVALAASALVTAAAGVGALLFGAWVPLTGRAAVLLSGAVGLLVLGYLMSIQTMRHGELSFVAPFRYTALLWAIAVGVLVFGDFPDTMALVGAGIVVAAGLFTLQRERMLRRRAAAAAGGGSG